MFSLTGDLDKDFYGDGELLASNELSESISLWECSSSTSWILFSPPLQGEFLILSATWFQATLTDF